MEINMTLGEILGIIGIVGGIIAVWIDARIRINALEIRMEEVRVKQSKDYEVLKELIQQSFLQIDLDRDSEYKYIKEGVKEIKEKVEIISTAIIELQKEHYANHKIKEYGKS